MQDFQHIALGLGCKVPLRADQARFDFLRKALQAFV